ncbi:MAG: aldo/keto reductase [Acetanaerobacterium sp.]
MKTKTISKNGDSLSILGFGCMRLPSDDNKAIKLIHDAIDEGVNYFDTAYIYQGGRNETLLGKALAGGRREQVKIATKLPPFMVGRLDNAKKIFATELSRLQTDHIDYYLLHMLGDKSTYDRLAGLGVIDWLESLKAEGAIKNIGFSFHGGKAEFEGLIKAYPWDFCQIQYNYMDENNQATKSGLQLAASMGIPVIVMEPLRGGKLVTHLPEQVKKAFAAFDASRSPVDWALRWIWNHPEVNVVLSGMNDEAQLAENIRIANDSEPNSLSDTELEVFARVRAELMEKTKIPCTACGYCMPCPAGVNIPGCFSSYNEKYLIPDKSVRMRYFQSLGAFSSKPAVASQCKECGKCESHCPQQISIRQELKRVDREMEGIVFKPLMAISRKIMRIK